MHTEKREDPLVELGYEVRDLNTKAIRNGAIGFFIFAFGSGILGFMIFRVMSPASFAPEKAQHRLLPQEPNPIVQSNMTAKTDIMELRRHEREVMEAPVGWTDNTHTRLHIPIDMAMQIIAGKGRLPGDTTTPLPVVAPPQPKPVLSPSGAGGGPQPTQTPGQPAVTGGVTPPVSATSGATTKPVPTQPAAPGNTKPAQKPVLKPIKMG